ncbi:MAG: elongation factor-1 alpha [Sideroxyarcus sp.]|nr:elongation factor-1 alpha [Sideroxyarcus sp.]
MKAKRFYDCTLSEKLLYTSFLLLVGLGYLMAMGYLYVSHEMNDKKPGLSVSDVANSYYGNRSGTRLEAAIRGSMAGYIDDNDRNKLVAWLKDGAEEDHFEKEIKPIMAKTCLACHSKASGMPVIDYSTYEGLHEVAQVDTGMSIGSLLRVSHIHLFGISLLLFALGFIFIQSEINVWFKRFLVLSPMVAVFFDVLSWFLTKWDSHYAIVVIIAGAMLGFSMASQILISLYQLWFLKKPTEQVPQDPLA